MKEAVWLMINKMTFGVFSVVPATKAVVVLIVS